MNANLGGFMLAIYSLAFTLFAAKSAVMGQLPHQNTQRNLAVVLLAIAAVTLSTWGWSLLP